MKAIELTTTEFQTRIYDFRANPEWKYEGDLPAVIDFYAPWCGPCRMMGPVMESLAEEYAGKVRMYKVNVDKEKRLAAIFRVRSIPTFLFIPVSGEPKHANGAMEIAQMRRIDHRHHASRTLNRSTAARTHGMKTCFLPFMTLRRGGAAAGCARFA